MIVSLNRRTLRRMGQTRPFHFVGNCVDNPFPTVEELTKVIESAKQITKRTFHSRCEVDIMVRGMMVDFPNDYTYWKSRFRGHVVYFYEWSRIEHFYVKSDSIASRDWRGIRWL